MSYGSTSFINCDKKDLEACCEKLLTQPPSFQFETLATLLCYFPYLSSTLMSLKILCFFFYLFESSKKSAPKYTAISWISVAVADLRETARVHSPAASALLISILKELRCNMKVNFWDRQNSLALGLPSPLSPNNSELFFPQDWKLYSGTLEMFSLYHERSLPMNICLWTRILSRSQLCQAKNSPSLAHMQLLVITLSWKMTCWSGSQLSSSDECSQSVSLENMRWDNEDLAVNFLKPVWLIKPRMN